MRILVSKPDSFGDQLIAAGWIQALLPEGAAGTVIWHVRAGMESVAALLSDVAVFAPQLDRDPAAESRRLMEQHPAGIVLVPYPLDAFADWTDETDTRIRWWTAFLAAQAWTAAVAAVGNRTWVAELSVAATRAPRRIGARPTPARQIPVNLAGTLLGEWAPTFHEEVPCDPCQTEQATLGALLGPLAAQPSAVPSARLRPVQPAAATSGKILLAPGAGGDARRVWPIASFLALATALRSRGESVAWLLGPGDRRFLESAGISITEPVFEFAANALDSLAAHLRGARALVCNDTGHAHLAALLDVTTVAIFGGGQGRRFHPQIGRVRVVQAEPACAGCQWHCVYDGYPCFAAIPVAAVAQALLEQLAGGATDPLVLPLSDSPWLTAATPLRRLQDEILTLNADRFARLQIIQTLVTQASRATPPAKTTPVSRPRLSVIVPAGRPERAAATLAALAAQEPNPDPWEVIVVGAGVETIVRPAALPVKCIALPQRATPAATRSAGVAAATGDWFVFIDDDIEPAPDFLASARILIAGFAAAWPVPAVGAIGARLPGRRGGFWERVTDWSNFWTQQGPEPRECDWLYSAALLVPAAVYRQAGGFDPALAVGEDVDLTQRIRAAGYRVRYEPMLIARHDHRRDTPLRMWRYFWANGAGAPYFFRALGGTCAFSLKTVWLKSWSDLAANRTLQRSQGRSLGAITPLIWLNYLIVEASLEWHWQRELATARRFRTLPTRSRSDRTAARALADWTEGRRLRGALRYTLAMLQDFSNPVRR